MLALGAFEAEVHTCGFHRSLTRDKANHFTFETDVCTVCAGAERWGRMQQDADEQQREAASAGHKGGKVPPTTPDPADGRTNLVRLMSKAEVEQRGGPRGNTQ